MVLRAADSRRYRCLPIDSPPVPATFRGRGRFSLRCFGGDGSHHQQQQAGGRGLLRSREVGDLSEAEAAEELEAIAREIAAHDVRYYQVSVS